MRQALITHPSTWDSKYLPSKFINQSPGASGRWGNYEFFINEDIEDPETWFVYGDLDGTQKKKCARLVYITSEERSVMPQVPQNFLAQFDLIITSRDDIIHPNVIKMHYICPWQIRKTYDQINKILPYKSSNLSAIISDNTNSTRHKKRFAVINQLKGHFRDELDWFGWDKKIYDKWDGLSPYKYSIAIENSIHSNYFTEKLTDCFLSLTIPIYFGCPNITDFFPEKSIVTIDINSSLDKMISTIEETIRSNFYEYSYKYLITAKDLVLKRYNVFPSLCKVLEEMKFTSTKKPRKVRSMKYFKKNSIFDLFMG